MKLLRLNKENAKKFYGIHKEKPFFESLCEYMTSGPIIVMTLEKENAVLENRNLMGATNPKEAADGTIRKKYGISID